MKPGVAFGDYITTGEQSRYSHRRYDNPEPGMRTIVVPILLVFLIGVILFKLVSLQFVNGRYYRNLADSNRIRTTIVYAQRGVIFDRNGEPLVVNIPGYRKIVRNKTQLIRHEKAIELLAKGEQGMEVDSLRKYPYTDALSHVLGYIGQISEEELNDPKYKNYRAGDLIGKMGIEEQYEQKLKGSDGKKLVEVDSSGKALRTLGQTEPTSGQNITVTLDAKLQTAAYTAMKDVKKGVVVASTPQGEIMAMLSKPGFDPNLFTLDETYKTATDAAYFTVRSILADNENQPLLNRAIGGVYPPGSTFKLITAASGLENNAIDEKFTVEDTGILRVGAFSFANWYFTNYGKTEGEVNIVKAIKRSNDIYFYKAADKIGVERLSATARKFGLGSTLGIDIDGEVSGLVPDPAWKKRVINESWYLGDNFHYGIGQGFLLTTPLQVNTFTQAIANKGTLYVPHLLKNYEVRIKNKGLIGEKTYNLIKQGMVESCAPGGVGWPLFQFKIQNAKLQIDGKNFFAVPEATTSAKFKDYRHIKVACKTGTAQHGDEKTMPHSWITLWAPAENPTIILTVLAESSGEGSNVAGPIAKNVLEEWFGR